MNIKMKIIVSSLALMTAVIPVRAQSLLGVIGGGDSGALVTVDSGQAGSSGLVNLGLGGGGGNLVDANVAPSSNGNLVDANVNLGGSSALGVDANVGGLVDAEVDVGGQGGLLTVDVGIGGDSGTGGGGGNGGNGGNGNGAGSANAGGLVFGGSGGSAAGSGQGACASSMSAQQLVNLFATTTPNGWNRASNIQLVPIKVCASLRKQVAEFLATNGSYVSLVSAVSADPLIRAALSRTSYQPGQVLAVQRNGDQLTVYVF